MKIPKLFYIYAMFIGIFLITDNSFAIRMCQDGESPYCNTSTCLWSCGVSGDCCGEICFLECDDIVWSNTGSTRQVGKVGEPNSDCTACTLPTIIVGYRCRTGYYGTQVNANSDACTRCAAEASFTATDGSAVYGTVAAGVGTTQSNCYVPSGNYKDSAGEFTATNTCPYQ